jgi:hypothetical protein
MMAKATWVTIVKRDATTERSVNAVYRAETVRPAVGDTERPASLGGGAHTPRSRTLSLEAS